MLNSNFKKQAKKRNKDEADSDSYKYFMHFQSFFNNDISPRY
jgi:hypothetical protein